MNAEACTVEVCEFIKESAGPAGSTFADLVDKLKQRPAADDSVNASDGTTVRTRDIMSGLPWVRHGLQTITQLGALDDTWHELGVSAPNAIATELATHVLRQLSQIDFPPNSIDASSDEGVCLSFNRQNRRANIECFNSGEILGATIQKGGEPCIWEMTSGVLSDGIARIYSFIRE